ncbi:hypothetical protein D3C74_408620 [compost metagenome]
MALPSTMMLFSSKSTLSGKRPRTVSYFSRCASVLLSVRSLTPTISMSAPDAMMARKKLRPIRPKPLIPTRMVTMPSSGRAGVPDAHG